MDNPLKPMQLALAAALAFGLGSQKWAGEMLERFLQMRTRKKQ